MLENPSPKKGAEVRSGWERSGVWGGLGRGGVRDGWERGVNRVRSGWRKGGVRGEWSA